jgi:hypothetical protein
MKKQARLSYQEQTKLLTLQGATIALQRRQLALQEVMFAKLHDFTGQLNQQMQSARKDAAALGHPDSNREKG